MVQWDKYPKQIEPRFVLSTAFLYLRYYITDSESHLERVKGKRYSCTNHLLPRLHVPHEHELHDTQRIDIDEAKDLLDALTRLEVQTAA